MSLCLRDSRARRAPTKHRRLAGESDRPVSFGVLAASEPSRSTQETLSQSAKCIITQETWQPIGIQFKIDTQLNQSLPLLATLAFFASAAAKSRSWRRRILPAADLGITPMRTTPPRSCLWFETLPAIHFSISFASFWPSGEDCFSPPAGTMYARGTSVPRSSSWTPMTPTSLTLGWERRRPSSSAGGTWKPLYLMSSFLRSTMLESQESQETCPSAMNGLQS